MKTKENNLDNLKKENPFKVPEGYMENLTAQIMNSLPEKEVAPPAPRVTLMDRVKPWLYMAALFAGLGLFFKAIVGEKQATKPDLMVSMNPNTTSTSAAQATENEDFLEYLEDEYSGYVLAGYYAGTE